MLYYIFWTAELIFCQPTMYCGTNTDLPRWATQFNNMPCSIHTIFLQKTVVPNYIIVSVCVMFNGAVDISGQSEWQRPVLMACCWQKPSTSTCRYITLNRSWLLVLYSMAKIRQSTPERHSATSNFSRAALRHLYFSRCVFWALWERGRERRKGVIM